MPGSLQHGDAQRFARHRAGQLDVDLDAGLDDRLRRRRSTAIFAPKISLSRASAAAISDCFVGGRLHRGEHVLDRFDRRELAAEPHPIEPALGARQQPRHHHRHRRQRHREQPRPRRPAGSASSHGSVTARNSAEHDHAQQDQQRALDDQVVELEAVLEVDRRDHEVDRRRSRDALEDHAEQLLLAHEDQRDEQSRSARRTARSSRCAAAADPACAPCGSRRSISAVE